MKRIVKVFLLFGILVILLFLFIRFYLPSFLIYNHPVDSEVVVIESWISAYEVERIADYLKQDPEARCIVVGKHYIAEVEESADMNSHNYNKKDIGQKGIWLLTNSSLTFNLSGLTVLQSGDSVTISVTAKGTEAAGYFPYFNIVVNGHFVKGYFVKEEFNDFYIKIPTPEKGIESLCLRFTNDIFTGNEDRNLSIHSVKIGGFTILATPENVAETEEQTKETTGFNSQSEEVAQYLVGLGVNSQKMTTLDFKPVICNQTLASAKALKEYFEKKQISNLNVLSSGFHSRRTWFTYQKVLGPSLKVGVIYYPPVNYSQQNLHKTFSGYLYLLNEFVSYVVNWLSLSSED
ncbi:MAG: carbohydrate-binding domain-containing protein [Bacteroidales bacterium]